MENQINTTSNKKSFLKSKTFIIFTSLACLFFVIFLFSVINTGIRYNFFRLELLGFIPNADGSVKYELIDNLNGNPISDELVESIREKLKETETVWNILLSSESSLKRGYGYEYFNSELLKLDIVYIRLPEILWTKFKDVNMNLGYTVMTIVFVSCFVVCGFVPLAYWMCELSKKRQKKVKKQKAQKQIKALSSNK